MKKMMMVAVAAVLMVTAASVMAQVDCDGNPCSTGGYVWVNMQGTSLADAGPGGTAAAFALGQYDVGIDVQDLGSGVNFTGNLAGGYMADSGVLNGVPAYAQGLSQSFVEWGIERW